MTDKQNDSGAAAIPPDPIYQKSYSVHIALASVALVGAVAFAIADEIWLRRPYKKVQEHWKGATLAYLDKLEKERLDFDGALRALDDFKALDQAVATAEADTKTVRDRLAAEFADLSAEVAVLTEVVKPHRSEIGALTYDAEVAAHHAGDHDALASAAAKPFLDRIAEVEARKLEYSFALSDGTTKSVQATAGELIARFIGLQSAKGRKQSEIGEAAGPVSAAKRARDEWLARNLASIARFYEAPRPGENEGESREPAAERQAIADKVAKVGVQRYLDEYAVTVSPAVVAKLRQAVDDTPTGAILGGEIQKFQIHLRDSNNWVDRCEVCHLGARSVVPVTEDGLAAAVREAGWSESDIEQADLSLFASHPRSAELFAKHDPEKVGCSTCHNGNGIAITSTHLAHGENHHWNWPLFPKENLEAGCVQCHQKDLYLAGGERISAGRRAFFDKGCWGCHPYDGHGSATAEISKLETKVGDLRRAQDSRKARVQAVKDAALAIPDEREAEQTAALNAANAEGAKLQQEIAGLETEIGEAHRRIASLHNEREKVGPNLKDIRVAMRPEVITPWVNDPTHVRIDTKMPVFRWQGAVDADGLHEEAKDVAAYLYQQGLDPQKFPGMNLRAPAKGSPGRGKELFEKTGCLACHSVERDGKTVGEGWAANLSVVGDKKTYDWMFRWIKDPQHRLVPYSVRLHRDLTEAEAAQEDPATLVRRQTTRMPSFRLNDDDARDVATYLSTLTSDRKWPAAPWLTDASRAERGKTLVVYSGCTGCHEIAGHENDRGIGTDLTAEGSKPMDRLDFGHLTTAAKRGEEPVPDFEDWQAVDGEKPFEGMYGTHEGWYRPRGYFMHKLAKPDIYDTSKVFTDRFLRSRMPTFRFTGQQLHDMTTFLLGSVESRLPQKAMYNPDAAGQAVREGWWLVKKYNCQGCHPVEAGERPGFWGLPWFTAEDLEKNRDRLMPPSLVGEGFRVQPDWLARFLHDPSLGGGTANPRSVRRHLDVRMPTYSFTENEAATLVRFFEGLAKQPFFYQAPDLPALGAAERKAAEAIAGQDAANCFLCHLQGDQKPTSETKGPHLGYAKDRLRPEWTRRWIPDPHSFQPWTAMTKNFQRETDGDPRSRWISNQTGVKPEIAAVKGDHVDLIVRWLQEIPAAPK